MNDEVVTKLILDIEKHEETFDDIQKLIFTDQMKKKQYNDDEQKKMINNFFKWKTSAINAITNKSHMRYIEIIVIYRIIEQKFNKQGNMIDIFNYLIDLADNNKEDLKRNIKGESNFSFEIIWNKFKDDINKCYAK